MNCVGKDFTNKELEEKFIITVTMQAVDNSEIFQECTMKYFKYTQKPVVIAFFSTLLLIYVYKAFKMCFMLQRN